MIHPDWAGWISGAAAWTTRAGAQASLLALLVIAAQRILRGRLTPRARCLMWSIVVVRLIIPPLPQARWTMFPSRPAPASTTPVEIKPAAQTTPRAGTSSPARNVDRANHIDPALVAELKAELAAMPSIMPAAHSPPSVDVAAGGLPARALSADKTVAPRSVSGTPSKRTWPTLSLLLASLWLTGAILSLLRILLASLRLHRLVRDCSPLDDRNVESLARSCARQVGLRRAPPILDAIELSSPAVAGLFWPKLLLPSHLPIAFSRGELRLMLLHEFAHLRRRDLQVSWLLSLLQALHWFNPLLRWAFNRLRADCEMACDEFVLTLTQPAIGADSPRQTYGRTLLRLAEQMSQFPHEPMPAGLGPTGLGPIGILDTPRHLHRRILMIAAFNPASRRFSRTWPAFAAGVMLLCAGIVLADATDPSNPKPAPAPPRESPPATTAAPKPVLTAAAAPKTPPAESSPVIEALRQKYAAQQRVLDQVKAQYDVAEERFRVGQTTNAEVAAARSDIARAEADLATALVDLRRAEAPTPAPTSAVPIDTASLDVNAAKMKLLAAQAALNQASAARQRATALHNAGAESTAELEATQAELAKAQADVAVREAELQRAYSIRNAAGTTVGGGFAPPPAAAGPNPFAGADSLPTENIQDAAARRADFAAAEKLHKPMTADFADAKMTDALQYFADKAGVDVVTDWKAMEDGPAVSPNAPVNLRIRQQTPGDQILRFMLRDRGVGFTIDHGVLFISVQDKIDHMTVTRVYDTTVFGAAAAQLPKLIQEIIDPNSWRDNGGSVGTVRVFTDKLIVTQTFANQCEVEKLLALLAAKNGAKPI